MTATAQMQDMRMFRRGRRGVRHSPGVDADSGQQTADSMRFVATADFGFGFGVDDKGPKGSDNEAEVKAHRCRTTTGI